MRFDLTGEEWAELEPLPPAKRKSARVDDRRVVNAFLHLLGNTIRAPGRAATLFEPSGSTHHLWMRQRGT